MGKAGIGAEAEHNSRMKIEIKESSALLKLSKFRISVGLKKRSYTLYLESNSRMSRE